MIESIVLQNVLSFKNITKVNFNTKDINLIYGANASGKTNLLNIISFVSRFVKGDTKITRLPVHFEKGTDEESIISIDFNFETIKYKYTIVWNIQDGHELYQEELRCVNDDCIVLDEDLFSDYKILSDVEKETIHVSKNLNHKSIIYKVFDTLNLEDELFKTHIERVMRMMSHVIIVSRSSEYDFEELGRMYSEFTHDQSLLFKKYLKRVFSYMDIPIRDIEVKDVTDENLSFLNNILEREDTNEGVLNYVKDQIEQISKLGVVYDVSSVLYSNNRAFPLASESAGTKSIIRTLIILCSTNESVIIYDEFDISLHEAMTIELLTLLKEMKNTHQCQFIFSTHNVEMFSNVLLNSKQYYVIYREDLCSQIIRVSDIDGIRNDSRHSFKNLYRHGKIPGYPHYGKEV